MNIKPLAQNNSISCGQTSVAMCINLLTGKNLIDADINNKYGFNLLEALNAETKPAGVIWKDGGNLTSYSWSLIEQKVNKEGLPVIVGLNGPEFSASGRGHIVTITKIEGDTVHYADPATGTMKTATKQAMNTAPSHPDGNFIFYASRQTGQTAEKKQEDAGRFILSCHSGKISLKALANGSFKKGDIIELNIPETEVKVVKK